MAHHTLISCEELAAIGDQSTLAIVDCRFDLKDVTAGRRAFEAGHIPGAVYASLDTDLSGPKTGGNGRHPLPDPNVFARSMGTLGLSNDSQVVVYDENTGMYAARLWWMLRWIGHDDVRLLDGGISKWKGEGRPIASSTPAVEPRLFVPHLRPEMAVTVDDVARRDEQGWQLLDARSAERYRGEAETLDRAAGHIPGAANRFFQQNLKSDGTFLPARDLEEGFRALVGDGDGDRLVCYCGSGVTACHNLLALEHAGIFGAKLYAGSWSEWSADPARPIATRER